MGVWFGTAAASVLTEVEPAHWDALLWVFPLKTSFLLQRKGCTSCRQSRQCRQPKLHRYSLYTSSREARAHNSYGWRTTEKYFQQSGRQQREVDFHSHRNWTEFNRTEVTDVYCRNESMLSIKKKKRGLEDVANEQLNRNFWPLVCYGMNERWVSCGCEKTKCAWRV